MNQPRSGQLEEREFVIFEALILSQGNSDPYSSYSAVEALPDFSRVHHARRVATRRVAIEPVSAKETKSLFRGTADPESMVAPSAAYFEYVALQDFRGGCVHGVDMLFHGRKFAIERSEYDRLRASAKITNTTLRNVERFANKEERFCYKSNVHGDQLRKEISLREKQGLSSNPITPQDYDLEAAIDLMQEGSQHPVVTLQNVTAWYPIGILYGVLFLCEDQLIFLPGEGYVFNPTTKIDYRLLRDSEAIEYFLEPVDYNDPKGDAGMSIVNRARRIAEDYSDLKVIPQVIHKKDVQEVEAKEKSEVVILKLNSDAATDLAAFSYVDENLTSFDDVRSSVFDWWHGRMTADDDPLFARADLPRMQDILEQLEGDRAEALIVEALDAHAQAPDHLAAQIIDKQTRVGVRIGEKISKASPTLSGALEATLKEKVDPELGTFGKANWLVSTITIVLATAIIFYESPAVIGVREAVESIGLNLRHGLVVIATVLAAIYLAIALFATLYFRAQNSRIRKIVKALGAG